MKKSFLVALVLLFVFAGNLFAEGSKISFWGGYTTLNMKDINDLLKQNTGSHKKVKDGFIIGLDYLFLNINENINLGGRVAYLKANKWDKKLRTEDNINFSLDKGVIVFPAKEVSDVTNKVGTSLIPIMVGGEYKKNISEKISLNGKLFAGYGLISFDYEYKSDYKVYRISDGSLAYREEDKNDKDETKGCFVADISVGTEYSFTKKWGLGIDVGYRFTPKTKVEDGFKVDFSGLTTALNLNYKF
jgi:hypothetical protein